MHEERKPTMNNATILIVDDERNVRESLGRLLRDDYNVLLAEDGRTALQLLADNAVDAVLSDIRMPGMDGLELLAAIRERHPSVAVIMLSAYGDIETAVEAMRRGAADFLSKPANASDLSIRIERALHSRAVEAENLSLRRQLDAKYGMRNIIGSSPAMQEVFNLVRSAAPSPATVLIQGPSGTGKELVARAIHQLSPRKDKPFVAVHCASLPTTLLESELFGHEAGAFTGAVARQKGRFELASGGTLFLDEIGEIEESVQVKLLRVLQERSFERIGGTETIRVDIRLVAATNRDLRRRIAEGRFREDLFYRLNVIPIQMPPLRARTGDIPTLFAHFLHRFNEENGKAFDGIDPAAMETLLRYSWPGNVRELENVVERMVVLGHGTRLGLDDIPADDSDNASSQVASSSAPLQEGGGAERRGENASSNAATTLPQAVLPPEGGGTERRGVSETAPSSLYAGTSLADAAKSQILSVLDACGGNRSQAAARLGISRRTLHRKLAAWGIQKY